MAEIYHRKPKTSTARYFLQRYFVVFSGNILLCSSNFIACSGVSFAISGILCMFTVHFPAFFRQNNLTDQEARNHMDNQISTLQTPANSSPVIQERVIDCAILRELIAFQLQNNPALSGKTKSDIARACDMSETTYKNLLNGKAGNPHVGTLVRLIRYIGGGSIDRMVGLAPPRDFAKEDAAYDANLVQAIQIRLEEKRSVIDDLQSRLAMAECENDRLRKLVLEKGERQSKASAESSALKDSIAEYKERLARRDARIKLCGRVIIFLVAILALLLIADLLIPSVGWLRFDFVK